MTDTLEHTAKLIADRGRDALVARLRPAFADAASARAEIIQLDDQQLEQMVQRAADRADGLQWRRALASVASEELGIGLVPYSPLCRGYLTGKIDEGQTFDPSDIRSHNPRFTPEAMRANRVVVDLLTHAEGLGFSHGWTFDSHVLWQEPYVIYAQVLERTTSIDEGPEGHVAANAGKTIKIR